MKKIKHVFYVNIIQHPSGRWVLCWRREYVYSKFLREGINLRRQLLELFQRPYPVGKCPWKSKHLKTIKVTIFLP